jgi:hypothetical protein
MACKHDCNEDSVMTKHMKILVAFVFTLMGITIAFSMGLFNSQAQNTDLSQVTFYVQ